MLVALVEVAEIMVEFPLQIEVVPEVIGVEGVLDSADLYASV